ncbi:MAG: DNA polymerase III subunit alpha [Turneriella sp.]|nr:DNA polymerase III subunit alpha [Turneriella sp.]
MATLDFTHLHLHSTYSLLDGAIRPKELVKKVKELGMKSVAITDHGNMFAAIEFYEAAKAEGIKPIIGYEAYVAPGSRFEKRLQDDLVDGRAYHLILLAKDQEGYKSLIKLASKAYTEGLYYKPRIDYELLAEYSKGLIGTTACLAGEVNRLIYRQKMDKAKELAGRLNEILGKGNFFLEIQNHGIPEQIEVTKGALQLSKELEIPLVLTNDSHFLTRADQKAQEVMLRIQMNKKMSDPLEFGFNDEFYVKSPEEMFRLYPELPQAFHQTTEIAEMCNFEFEFGAPLLPDFEIPLAHGSARGRTGMPALSAVEGDGGAALRSYFLTEAKAGLERRMGGNVSEEHRKRLEYELGVIENMGFEGYFLIVADFINYAKRNNIPVGPGRGSAVGSLVAYSLGITDLDPLKYDLLFERFLNPSRKEMPDIDVDFCRDRREEVIKYVVQKYGEDHVSQIITFGTLSAKAVIKDVARVLGVDYQLINALSKNLPDKPGTSLEEAVAASPEIQKYFEQGEKERELFNIAKRLEGMPRNAGKHAAGVVIAPRPLDDIVPLAKDSKTDSVVTQFDMNLLPKVGLVKMDFLGLKNLTIIQHAVEEIERRRGIKIDIQNLPLDDEKTYQLLSHGKTRGVFQVESTGITKLLMQAKPRVFEDIVAIVALYRPGPLESGMTESYVKRKNGEMRVEYPHASLEPILKDTYGTFVYQEQIMLASQIVGGFTLAEADTLRKAMGKKKVDVMEKMKAQFVAGAKEKNHKEKWASELFDNMAEFAKYGFNKSHSAAYGLITYQTAYLKVNYTIEFFKASMDADIGDTDKIIGYINHAKELGIEVLPPDVNESDVYFTILDEHRLRFGLLGIKGLGEAPAQAIVDARVANSGRFKSLVAFVESLDAKTLNRRVLDVLTFAGALDSLGFSRAAIIHSADEILKFASTSYLDRTSGQSSLFGGDEIEVERLQIPQVPEFSSEEKLLKEKMTLGLYLTSHPLDKFGDALSHIRALSIADLDDGASKERRVSIVGVIDSIRTVTSKRGAFYILQVADKTGQIEIKIFPNLYEQVKNRLRENACAIFDLRVLAFREEEITTLNYTLTGITPEEQFIERVEKSLHLYLNVKTPSALQNIIGQVKTTLRKYSGNNPVYLYWREKEDGQLQSIKAHSSFCVRYDKALLKDVGALLGAEKYALFKVGGRMEVVG